MYLEGWYHTDTRNKAVSRIFAEDSSLLELIKTIKAVVFFNGPQRQSTTVSWMTLLLRIAQENLLEDPGLERTVQAWLQKHASSLKKLPSLFKKRSLGIKVLSFYGPLGPLLVVRFF